MREGVTVLVLTLAIKAEAGTKVTNAVYAP